MRGEGEMKEGWGLGEGRGGARREGGEVQAVEDRLHEKVSLTPPLALSNGAAVPG